MKNQTDPIYGMSHAEYFDLRVNTSEKNTYTFRADEFTDKNDWFGFQEYDYQPFQFFSKDTTEKIKNTASALKFSEDSVDHLPQLFIFL